MADRSGSWWVWGLSLALAISILPVGSSAQDRDLAARWSFEPASGPVARDSVSSRDDAVEGDFKYVPGVRGTGLRFDGYTTGVIRKAANAPNPTSGLTVEAWVALNTYPWNWVPVVDDALGDQAGYFFGIDAYGHVGLQVAAGGAWEAVTSSQRLPLKKWAHIVGTYSQDRGLAIYIDGKEVGNLSARGPITPAGNRVDLLIGRVRQPLLPVPGNAIHPKEPIWYSLDGILDEVKIYDRDRSAEEVHRDYSSIEAPTGDVLPWPKLPSGPPGAGRFGAYYATLKFQDTWDRLRRIGPDSDVVVRFDESPMRLVFWQGLNYIPAWVTENGKWYTDEFLETWGAGCPDGGDCEPMSDKQERYSHVRILESSPARVVVDWRYAPSEVEHDQGAWPDPATGWFDWADEYWTVYPDGVAVRKQVLWSTRLDLPHEWQETIVINAPGTRPEDNINWDALTLENMQGQTAIYSWHPKPPGTFSRPIGPNKADRPENPNIQIVNLKSVWKPFQIVSPVHSRFNIYNGERTYFSFECWNHWPVAQIISSGRPCLADDRASHSSLSHVYWEDYATTPTSETKILLDGLTPDAAAEILPLAKSWLSPPAVEVSGPGYSSKGYDPAQRAFVIVGKPDSPPAALKVTLDATAASPLFDPAILVKNWNGKSVRLKIDSKAVAWSGDSRYGLVQRLTGTDLVVWLRKKSVAPLEITLFDEKGR
ncbi:MAG: LamG domain-containing protein [Terriglobia bacterium]